MALAALKVWVADEVLFADDLVDEFANIYENPMSLISPWTSNLDADGFDLLDLDELEFKDATANASASGRLRRNGADLTFHDGTAARNVLLATSLSRVEFVRATSDRAAINSSSTLVDDGVLQAALVASEVVAFECFVVYNSDTTADIKFAFTVPASATLVWTSPNAKIDPTGTAAEGLVTSVSGTSSGFSGSGSGDVAVLLVGTVVNSTNAGNLVLQLAQQTSNASDTIRRANSWLRVWRV